MSKALENGAALVTGGSPANRQATAGPFAKFDPPMIENGAKVCLIKRRPTPEEIAVDGGYPLA